MTPILIQVIGFIGLVFIVASFQQKNRKAILLFIMVGQVIFLFHFVLLGAWTAAGMNFVGACRTLIFRFSEDKTWANWRFWPVVFITLFIIAGLLAHESWIGLLPVVAMTIETTGLWMKEARLLRLINLFPHPFWFVYNLIKGSWAGVICEVFVLSSVIVAVFRYDLKSKKIPDLNK
jgi:hypothetical protein